MINDAVDFLVLHYL